MELAAWHNQNQFFPNEALNSVTELTANIAFVVGAASLERAHDTDFYLSGLVSPLVFTCVSKSLHL